MFNDLLSSSNPVANIKLQFSDCYYIATLMKSMCEALMGKREPEADDSNFDMEREIQRQAETQLDKECIAEIDRYRRMDEWTSSFHNIYSRTAIECQRRLMQAKIIDFNILQFFQCTRAGTFDLLRLEAFKTLAELNMFKHPEILTWFMYNMSSDRSPWMRRSLHRIFGISLATVAFGDEPTQAAPAPSDDLVIEQESSTEARKADLARRQTVPGAIEALKKELSGNKVLKEAMWAACNSPYVSLSELRDFMDICAALYDPIKSMMVRLKYPRYWRIENQGRVSAYIVCIRSCRHWHANPMCQTGEAQIHQDRRFPDQDTRTDSRPSSFSCHNNPTAEKKTRRSFWPNDCPQAPF